MRDQLGNERQPLSSYVKRVNGDSYWPLREIDFLYERADLVDARANKPRSSFIASELQTTFNNLSNQTFTVVNSLLLTQYNDRQNELTRAALQASSSPATMANASGELSATLVAVHVYACVVEADYRHSVARLAINMREPAAASLPLQRAFHAPSAAADAVGAASGRSRRMMSAPQAARADDDGDVMFFKANSPHQGE